MKGSDYVNNYIEYEDDYENDYYQRNKFSIKKYLKYIIIVVVLLLGYFGYRYFTSYKLYEHKMILEARKYIKNNNIQVNNEIYLEVSKLGVEIPNNCSLTSGVIYDGNSYKSYLSCSDYESKILDNDLDEINLLGDEVNLLLKGMEYTDPGFISNREVKVTGSIGTEAGVYNLYYAIDDNYVTRKVIIIDNSILLREYPELKLNGSFIENIDINEKYVDKGANASDNIDGNITNNIQVINLVNNTIEGEYNVIYKIKNSRGYKKEAIRKVIVGNGMDGGIISGLSTNGLTNKNVKIIFNILSDNYSSCILPNKEVTQDKNFEYEVEENGLYEFIINDVFGKSIKRVVEVKNIDKENPNGTCVAYLAKDYTEIIVNTPEGKVISKYTYIIDGVSTEQVSSVYKTNTVNPKEVSVKLKDSVGNENTIKCSQEEKKSNIPENGITRIIDANGLKEPITDALSKRNYTVNDLNMCIYNKVKEALPGTRYGVVAAAVGLLDCTKDMTGYTIPYDHTGGKVETEADGTNYCNYNSDICGKLGVNTRWGKKGGSCKTEPCYFGLNCANFVHWALCNGGMDMCTKGAPGATSMSKQKYFPEADSFNVKGKKVSHFYGNDLTSYGVDALLRMIKPGDLLHSYDSNNFAETDHIMVVVGVDDTGVYIAENGRKTRKISYSTLTNGERTYQVVLLEKYYNNPNNRNNLY